MKALVRTLSGFFAVALLLNTSVAVFAQQLTYFPPGDILPESSRGVQSRKVFFPDWLFPVQTGSQTSRHAFMGTQLGQYHGLSWSNDPRLFNYPHRDNQCEPRSWTVNPCPAGVGHQGVDIRANDNTNNKWPVVAVEDGVVTQITSNTTVAVRSGNHTVRYLHMHPDSIAAAGIEVGNLVSKGQVLGKVSCIMGGTCQTSRHLHFDAYTGSAGQGNFYHIYPSLIAAYRRAWGIPDGIVNGELATDPGREIAPNRPPPPPPQPPQPPQPPDTTCNLVTLSDPLPGVDRNTFSSLWRHNCAIMGLVANLQTGDRSFVYYRPRKSLEDLVTGDPVLFDGKNEAGRFSGTAKRFSSRCGTQRFQVEGLTTAENGNPTVTVTGQYSRHNSDCEVIGTGDETLRFTFIEKVTPQHTSLDHAIPETRMTLSEVTRNFLALTFYPGADGQIRILPYFADFPGYTAVGGVTDSSGGLIPALQSDEAGVAISWVWMQKRARFTGGLLLTPRTVAYSMAGVEPSACDAELNPTAMGIAATGGDAGAAGNICNKVLAYLRGYIGFTGGSGFAGNYFGRRITIDETLDLADPDTAWNWMRTMYSHESGRAPVIGKDTFARGLRLGTDYIAFYYEEMAEALRPLAFYSDPCNFDQAGCRPSPEAGRLTMAMIRTERSEQSDSAQVITYLVSELEAMRARLDALEAKVEELGRDSGN